MEARRRRVLEAARASQDAGKCNKGRPQDGRSRLSPSLTAVESVWVVLAATCQETSRAGWPGVRARRERPVLQERPSNVVSCLGRGRESVRSDVAVRAPDAGSIRPVQPQGSGSGATVRARAVSRVPVGMAGTFAPPAALSVATEPPRRLQSIAGVAGLHPSHNPEIAAHRRCVLRETFAPLVCASHELATRRGVRSLRARIAHRARRYWRVTASDVRAQCHRLCLYAAFRRVTEGSELRDGLLKAITPRPRGAQRSSPNDSRNGSNRRALTALLESWVNDSRDWRFPGEAPVATPTKRRAAPASSKPTAHNGSGVPCSAVPPAAAIGAPGEQKHLPDMTYTMQQQKDNGPTRL